MENVESLDEIPNLSGQVSLSSVRAVFNGAYSSVFHGKLGDQPVAVKVLKEIYGADVRTMQRKLKRERTTWGRLRHPNVLPLFGFADDHELFHPYGALVSPWRAEGNACEFLKSRGNEMSIFKRVNMWKGVVAGVAYLHNHTPVLVHGDLKSANVLIGNNHEPQICDFGLVSIFLEEGSSGMTTTSAHTGTDRYLAYELVRGGETVAPTTASDMFALGCIGLEFCFLQQPYSHRKNNMRGQIFIDIRAGVPPATRATPSGSWNDALWTVLDRCWEGHPSNRIGARDLQARLEEALCFEFVDPASQNATQPPGSPGESVDENSITDTKLTQISGLRHALVESEHMANTSHGTNRLHPNESINQRHLSMDKTVYVPPTGGPFPSPQSRHESILHENQPGERFPAQWSHMGLILNPPRTTGGDSMLRKGDIMTQPHMAYHASAVGVQLPTQLHAEKSTASHVASTVHPASTSYGSQYRAHDTTTTDNNILAPIPDAPGFWGSGMVPEMGYIMAIAEPATQSSMDSSGQWELPNIASGTFDLGNYGKGPGAAAEKDSSWTKVEQEESGARAKASTSSQPQLEPFLGPAPTPISTEALTSLAHRLGPTIVSSAQHIHEKSKRTVIGDGSSTSFLFFVLSSISGASTASFGHLVYAQTGGAVQRRLGDIMPGDVVALYEARFKGHKGGLGLGAYSVSWGRREEPVLGIVTEFEGKKSKIKAFAVNQHPKSYPTIDTPSYKLDDLKAGTLKVFRVAETS